MSSILFRNPEQIVTSHDHGAPLAGPEQAKIDVITGKNLVVRDGKISEITEKEPQCDRVIDCSSRIILPGLIDSHTHIIYAGSRYDEFYQRARGETYLEILEAGNGIKRTIRDTEAASLDTVAEESLERVRSAVRTGTCTMEMKTGYSSSPAGEGKMLDAMDRIRDSGIIRVVETLLPLHALSMGKTEGEHLDVVLQEVIPKYIDRVDFIDSFCDSGAFTPESSAAFFKAAKNKEIRLHADEIDDIGCLDLCGKFRIRSADHLLKTTSDGIEKIRKSGAIANILPVTAFSLNETYADARRFSEKSVPFTLSSDSSPLTRNHSLLFAMHLGIRFCGMGIEEAINGCTINAAHSLSVSEKTGTIEPGKDGDLVVFDLEDYREIPYEYASSPVQSVFLQGKETFQKEHVS